MLPSGAELWAVSFDASDPYGRDRVPDFGLYLDEKWSPPWEHTKVPWQDFGVPSDHLDALRDRLSAVLAQAKAGRRPIARLRLHKHRGQPIAQGRRIGRHSEVLPWNP